MTLRGAIYATGVFCVFWAVYILTRPVLDLVEVDLINLTGFLWSDTFSRMTLRAVPKGIAMITHETAQGTSNCIFDSQLVYMTLPFFLTLAWLAGGADRARRLATAASVILLYYYLLLGPVLLHSASGPRCGNVALTDFEARVSRFGGTWAAFTIAQYAVAAGIFMMMPGRDRGRSVPPRRAARREAARRARK